MIIFRYLNREILTTLSAVTGILLLIFLSNQLVHYLSRVAVGKFTIGMVLRLLLPEVPHLLGILLPLGLFLGILLSFGRLYAEHEMTVLNACGVSRSRLIVFVLPVMGLVVIVAGILNLWLSPQLIEYRERLLAQTGTAMELETTLPGRFQEANGGRQVFYVENLSIDHQRMQNIFMAQRAEKSENPDISPWIILTAEGGYQKIDKKTGDRFLVATNGWRYQGTPGNKDFQIVHFGQYGIRIERHVEDIGVQYDTMSTANLWRIAKNTQEAAAELQWRLAAPLSALFLTLFAVPMSRIKPRRGKYAALLPAILAYIIYANLLLLGRNWIEQGNLSSHLGLWGIHAGFLLITLWIWLRQTGWRTIKLTLSRLRQHRL